MSFDMNPKNIIILHILDLNWLVVRKANGACRVVDDFIICKYNEILGILNKRE